MSPPPRITGYVGGSVALRSSFVRLLLRKRNSRKTNAAISATAPTVPPTIAPTFLLLPSCLSLGIEPNVGCKVGGKFSETMVTITI
jgi:hypothetical protein